MPRTAPPPDLEAERQRVFPFVQRYGWNPTAFQALSSGYCYFFHGHDSCVAYVDTGAAWVAAGSPLASPAAIAEVVRAFIAAAAARGRRSAFFGVEDRLLAAAQHDVSSIRIGEVPVWVPTDWPATVAARRSLRAQLRRASAKGVRVRRVSTDEAQRGPVRGAILAASARWLTGRRLAPMQFLARLDPFAFAEAKQYFVAELDRELVGFAAVAPVPARGGWLIENLVRDAAAPNGTAEALVDGLMHWAAGTDCRWLTLGLAPLAGEVAPPLRWIRRATRSLYDFDGLRTFKAKLGPTSWMPAHLAFARSQSALVSVVDALAAFTDGGFLSFGARSIRHRWRRSSSADA